MNHKQFWLGAVSTLAILIIGIFVLQLVPTNAALPELPQTETGTEDTSTSTNTKVTTLTLNSAGTSNTNQSTFINLRGKIIADSNVRYNASTQGTINKINVVRGQSVQKGDVVMELSGNKGNKHPVEIAYEQAVLSKLNLQKTYQNTTASTEIAIRQAEQQRKALDTSSHELTTSLELTRNAGRYAVEGATIALTNLQNTVARSQDLRNLTSDQAGINLDQATELARLSLQNSARGLIITLEGSVKPLLNGIDQITNDRAIHADIRTLDGIIDNLKDYRDLNDYQTVYQISDFGDDIYNLLDLLETSTEDLQSINNVTAKPLVDAWKQLSGTITGNATAAISQLTSTRNQIISGPTNSQLQLSPTDNQISGAVDQQQSLALTIEQAKNASALQEQAINSQLQTLAQQKIAANLGIEAAKAGAKTQRDSIEGQLALADKQIEQAQLQLSQLQVIASSDGYVVDIPVTIDEEVSPGRELITLYGETASYIRLSLNPSDREDLTPGTKLMISLSTSTLTTPATISKIAPVADQNGNIPVDATFDSDQIPAGLAPGTNVIARATLTPKNVLASTSTFVPINAIVIDNGQNYLWLYDHGVAHKITVLLGPTQSDQVKILTPLSSNILITAPLATLKDGQPVTTE